MNWSYIAGFFDGEGSVLGYGRAPRISIAQKRAKVLRDIQKFMWAQDIRSQIYKYPNSKRKDLSQLRVNATNEVISFIECVLPYLIVKKRECKNALGILRTRTNKRKKWRLSELLKMKELRQKGFTAKQIARELNKPIRTVEAYCYRDGKNGIRYDLIGFTNKL